jgi:2,4-diacetylphloroglucinol hydrolase
VIPVTYIPPEMQRQLEHNRGAVRGKPYERFFDPRVELRAEIVETLTGGPIDRADVLGTSADELNRLLQPGYLPGETGYCALADGTAYAASLTHFPGCTAEMIEWWFWWHSVEAERYMLWFPHSHVYALAQKREVLSAPGLSSRERYMGNTHRIREWHGSRRSDIYIRFIEPAEIGFDTERFPKSGIIADACGIVSLQRPRVEIALMVHLCRETSDGFELRSRYWMGDRARLLLPGIALDVGRVTSALGIKKRMLGERMAYEQLVHDQIEFTHLAGLLPAVHAEFGSG